MVTAELRSHARTLMLSAALWDLAGVLDALPDWWPPVSYVLAAAAIVAACVVALLDTLARRRAPTDTPAADTGFSPATPPGSVDPRATPARTAGQLSAAGVLLAAWILRGHAEIPPDPPLVAAELVAAALYIFIVRRRRTG